MNSQLVSRTASQIEAMATDPAAKKLEVLVRSAELLMPPGDHCSILVIDEHGLLRNGASPALPEDYLARIDRLKPDPNVGTCSAAAATGKVVVTPDFHADNKWSELKHLPISIGYTGAWSMPIKRSDGQVLGTFGTYMKKTRLPAEAEIATVAALAQLAAGILES